MTQYFYFALGPVQSFVAQARRTRDFWAGSFLLSWLTAVAIKEVTSQNGEIAFPSLDTDYLAWLEGGASEGSEAPSQGRIPNRFKALIPADFKPELVNEAVNHAWTALAEAVCEGDFPGEVLKQESRDIWNRQIAHTWDINWVITETEQISALDQRKNWRSYAPPIEAGVNCSVMAGWQELSGVPTPHASALNQFWDDVKKGRPDFNLDLGKSEHLCAIAFVKRRFVHYFMDFTLTMSSGWTLHGWQLDSGVPSVSWMAAMHWIENALEHPTEANRYLAELRKIDAEHFGERMSVKHIRCINNKIQHNHALKNFASLDGNLFFANFLNNEYREIATDASRALQAISKATGSPAPSPFYAVLTMDGDSLGVHMGDLDKQKGITDALMLFTKGVAERVADHNGFLVYAGGDDVLALLPLEDAFRCASSLRAHYLSCFDKVGLPGLSTLSGAIVFAHIKKALTSVLEDGHRLLDDVAKHATGRDAIAVRVWKPGGESLTWAQPWSCALDDEGIMILTKLAEKFKENKNESENFSSNFFYKIREHFGLLNPANESEEILNEGQAIELMTMEYLNAYGKPLNRKQREVAKKHVTDLLIQCRPIIPETSIPRNQWKSSSSLKVDGALLIRFLANAGVDL